MAGTATRRRASGCSTRSPCGRPAIRWPDHDVIIIGAGHNGLTAASLLARAGVDVLCIEKNRYVGGMASTVELFDGFHFEIAGSVVFPIAPYVVADLDLENCGLQPIEREIMATNIGDPGEPALHMYSNPIPHAPAPRRGSRAGRRRGLCKARGLRAGPRAARSTASTRAARRAASARSSTPRRASRSATRCGCASSAA